MPGQGSIFIGTKGVMLVPHVGELKLLPEDQYKGFEINLEVGTTITSSSTPCWATGRRRAVLTIPVR